MRRLWPALTALVVLSVPCAASADSVTTQTVFYQDVSWSPDGTQIAFSAVINKQPADLYTMVLKGKVVSQLTDNAAADSWPSWTKDGSQIVFSSKRDGNEEIYVMKSDGGSPKRLTENPARDAAPAVSPDGAEIAFVSDRDGNPEIYIMSIDGTNVERLTNTAYAEHNPHWSPDGSRIVCYTEDPARQDRVEVIDAATGEAQVIGDGSSDAFYPSWSANGQSIVYTTKAGETEKWVHTFALDGSKNEKLLPLPAFYARYSPDGKRIAYIGGAWPTSNIYVIDYSDGTLRCLTCDLQLAPAPSDAIAEKKSKAKK